VFANGAFVKFAWAVRAPAEPNVALNASQVRSSMVASTLIVTALVSSAAQRFAAYVNAFRR